MMKQARGVGWWLRAYGVALRMLPPELAMRRVEMRDCVRARLEEERSGGGRTAVWRVAVREIVDVVRTSLRLRRQSRRAAGLSIGERKPRMTDILRQDLRFAARSWIRRPGFALVAVVTLALGIGANTAMFSVADAVLFRPLPHREPERLAYVWSVIPGLDWRRAPVSYANYLDWREESRAFEDLAAMTGNGGVTVMTGGGPERIERALVSGNLFAVLGNEALIGRTLSDSDDEAGAAGVVVVSERFWRAHLGGRREALGQPLRVDDTMQVIVGVMPASFAVPDVDLWMPLGPTAAGTERDLRFLQVIGRLGNGQTLASAEAELDRIMERLAAAYPAENEGIELWVESQHTFTVGDVRPVLLVLLGSVGLVLLIACANLANLLLARGAARSRELAVRSALGAGRRRMVQQLLTESAALGLAGGAMGAALAYAASGVLLRLAPLTLPRGETITIDLRTLLFTAAISLAAGVLAGIAPALRVALDGAAESLREGGRGGTTGRTRRRLQRTLTVAQVGLALMLLVGAGLLINSLSRLLSVDPGFTPEGVIAVHVSLPESRYPEREQVGLFFDDVIARVDALPGVEEAGMVWALPFTNGWASGGAFPEGTTPEQPASIGMLPVRGNAFEALGMRLVRGRTYTGSDLSPDAGVVVINETMARLFWPGEDAVGRRFRRGSPEEERPWLTVIGVVADVKRVSLGDTPVAEAYFHHAHAEGSWARDMRLVVRTAGDPFALAPPIRRAIHAIDPTLAVGEAVTLPQLISRSSAGPRIRTLLATTFAGLAALLAVVGIYGVMSFAVSERRREIGVRMALGARAEGVLVEVLREAALLTATGVVLGLVAAAAGMRLLGSALFGVSPLDIPTYAAMAGLLTAAAIGACLIPAMRAARVDPLIALREE